MPKYLVFYMVDHNCVPLLTVFLRKWLVSPIISKGADCLYEAGRKLILKATTPIFWWLLKKKGLGSTKLLWVFVSKQFSLPDEFFLFCCECIIELWFIFHFFLLISAETWSKIIGHYILWNVIKKISTKNLISTILSRSSSKRQTLKNCHFL